jgi:hypothetical protein
MAIHLENSSSGVGALNRLELEWMDFEPPVQAVPEPAAQPEAAPAAWTESLPPAAFGPASPAAGSPPGPSALDDLGPPAVLATTAPADVAPAAAAPTGPTASATEIATLELTLADPLNRELVAVHGGALPVLDGASANPVLQNQIERYGPDLTARLMQLAQANTAVRDLYLGAMDEAAQNLGPGVMGAVLVPASGSHRHGDFVAEHWRFDPVAFTQAYAQAGLEEGADLAQRAFAATYGTDALQAWETTQGGDAEFTTRGYTLAGRFELTAPTHVDLDGHPNRERMGWTAASLNPDSHELRPLSLQAPPNLHNPNAVWFDPSVGWVTPVENVLVKQDFLDKAIPVVFIATMTWATAGAFGVAGGAGVATGTGIGAGGGVVGAMTAGAAFGAISGFYGGLMGEGKIDLGGMFRGALTGALTAGVTQATGLNSMGLNQAGEVTSYAQRALAVTGQATLQGALNDLSGGSFREGFTAGLAQGLGAEISRGLNAKIAELSSGTNPSIDAAQAGALRQFARVAQSAVSLLGNPDDPGHAFAMTFVNGLVGDVQQGLSRHSAGDAASPVWASAPDETAAETARLVRQNDAPPTLSAPVSVGHLAHDQALAQVNSRWGVGGASRPEGPLPASDAEAPDTPAADVRIEIVGRRIPYVEQVAEAIGGELHGLFVRGMQAASGALEALEITPLANVKAEIQTYLDARAEQGLSEAEIVVFGALYAASEALFPTNALDFTGGVGKGIAAVGAVVKLERGADEIASVAARALSRNGYNYEFDAHGRVAEVSGELHLNRSNGRNTRAQLEAGGPDRLADDQGGHYIARIFDGPSEDFNHLAQNGNFNMGAYRSLERRWDGILQAGGRVEVRITPRYDGDSHRPSGLTVHSWIDGVRQDPITFNNSRGGR